MAKKNPAPAKPALPKSQAKGKGSGTTGGKTKGK